MTLSIITYSVLTLFQLQSNLTPFKIVLSCLLLKGTVLPDFWILFYLYAKVRTGIFQVSLLIYFNFSVAPLTLHTTQPFLVSKKFHRKTSRKFLESARCIYKVDSGSPISYNIGELLNNLIDNLCTNCNFNFQRHADKRKKSTKCVNVSPRLLMNFMYSP